MLNAPMQACRTCMAFKQPRIVVPQARNIEQSRRPPTRKTTGPYTRHSDGSLAKASFEWSAQCKKNVPG